MSFADAFAIVAATGIFSTSAAYYLFKRLMDIQVQKAIDSHKSDLDKKAAALKTDLDIYAHARTIGLTRLEELRAVAIQELYGLMIKWQELFLDITVPNLPVSPLEQVQMQRLINWSQNLARIGDTLSIKVRDTALYFDLESYKVLAAYGQAATNLGLDLHAATFDKWSQAEPTLAQMAADFEGARTVLRNAYKDEHKKAQDALIIEFRRLMHAERVKRPEA